MVFPWILYRLEWCIRFKHVGSAFRAWEFWGLASPSFGSTATAFARWWWTNSTRWLALIGTYHISSYFYVYNSMCILYIYICIYIYIILIECPSKSHALHAQNVPCIFLPSKPRGQNIGSCPLPSARWEVMSWLDLMQSYLAPVCKWMCDPSHPSHPDHPATEELVQVISGRGWPSHGQQAGEREREILYIYIYLLWWYTLWFWCSKIYVYIYIYICVYIYMYQAGCCWRSMGMFNPCCGWWNMNCWIFLQMVFFFECPMPKVDVQTTKPAENESQEKS